MAIFVISLNRATGVTENCHFRHATTLSFDAVEFFDYICVAITGLALFTSRLCDGLHKTQL